MARNRKYCTEVNIYRMDNGDGKHRKRLVLSTMGIDHGGQVPAPRIWSRGTLVQIVFLRFLSYWYKKERSVTFKIRQNPFSADPAAGAHNVPPDPLVGWRGDTLTIPHTIRHRPTFCARHASPSEFQPDLRLCSARMIYRRLRARTHQLQFRRNGENRKTNFSWS